MGIERELKLALDAAGAERLAAVLGPPTRVVRQRNHYLDTPEGALRRRRYGLRLREENGRRLLTLKGPARVAEGMTERLELEAELAPTDAEALLAGGRTIEELPLPVPDALKRELGPGPLRVLGAIENQRRVYRLPLPDRPAGDPREAEIDLDRTAYPDGTIEHELEVEWPHPTAPFPEAEVRALLERAGVPWRPQARSKLSRFLEMLDRGGGSI